MRRGAGCIINVASLLGLKGGTGSVGYAASKAGVVGELGHSRYEGSIMLTKIPRFNSRTRS